MSRYPAICLLVKHKVWNWQALHCGLCRGDSTLLRQPGEEVRGQPTSLLNFSRSLM